MSDNTKKNDKSISIKIEKEKLADYYNALHWQLLNEVTMLKEIVLQLFDLDSKDEKEKLVQGLLPEINKQIENLSPADISAYLSAAVLSSNILLFELLRNKKETLGFDTKELKSKINNLTKESMYLFAEKLITLFHDPEHGTEEIRFNFSR